jgi:hypothetical protein
VFALLGSKTRTVWPSTRLGVHATAFVNIEGGHIKRIEQSKMTAARKAAARRLDQSERAYIREMGVEAGLFDLANSVPHESIHYLTRDQIAQFGIDRNEFRETPWEFDDRPKGESAFYKFFVEGKGADKKEFPSSVIRLSCGSGGRVGIFYARGLTANESATLQVQLSTSGGTIPLLNAGLRQYDWIENKRMFDVRTGRTDFATLLGGSSDPPEIIETSWESPAPYAHIIRLSSHGWSEAIEKLRQQCTTAVG